MLNIYIGNIGEKKVQHYNDAWFDRNVKHIKFDIRDQEIMRAIDEVVYRGNYYISSKFDDKLSISVRQLSTGCKTVLNVKYFPNMIFNAVESGPNALSEICKLDKGNIYMPYFILIDEFQSTVKVITPEKEVIAQNEQELRHILYEFYCEA